MKQTEINNLAKLIKKTGQYKPSSRPHKPEKQPSVTQLNEVYKLDLRSINISVE